MMESDQESDTNNGEASANSSEDDINVTLPERPDAKRLRKILHMRAKLRKKQKALEDRVVDWDKEDEEQRFCDEEIAINKVLVGIEMKLLKYKVLKDLPDDCKAMLGGGPPVRIIITGSGNETLNERLTAALKEKSSKVAKNITDLGTYLSVSEIEEIITSVREEQIAKGVTVNLVPPKTNKDAYDSLVQHVATLIIRAVKEARYSKGVDMFDDYLTESEAQKLRAEANDNPPPDADSLPLELAFGIIKQEGDAEKKAGVAEEDGDDVIVLSDDEADEQEDDDEGGSGSVESQMDQKPSASQLNTILNVKAEVDDNVSNCAVGDQTQMDLEKEIKQELITQVMPLTDEAPMNTSEDPNEEAPEQKNEEQEQENQLDEGRKEAGDCVEMVEKEKAEPVQNQEPLIEDQSTKAVVDEISPRDTVSPSVITIASDSNDNAPKEKAADGDHLALVAQLDAPMAEMDGVDDTLQQKDEVEVQEEKEVPLPEPKEKAKKEPKEELILPDEITSRPHWLKGETAAELAQCFTTHQYKCDDDDEIECVFENIKEHEPMLDKIDTSKNGYVWAWLAREEVEERERTPIEVIDLLETDDEVEGEEDENKEQQNGGDRKRGSEDNGDGEPPVRKARMACDELGKALADSTEDGSPLTLPDKD